MSTQAARADPRRKAQALIAGLAAALVCVLAGPALAQTLPTGGTVAQGTASIGAASGGRMTITQTSERAVVNWNTFSVGAGANVTFNQPDSSSAILNRVAASAGQSVIDGEIDANGQVFLVNPNGVAISSTGVVNATGGFVASSLDISDSDFMAGTLNFSGASSGPGVSNAGSITSSGYVALIGQSAANSGTITVTLGQVGLGAGASATLDPTGTGFLQVVLPADATNASGQALVSNSGTISAAGGAVTMSAAVAAGAVQQAVNMSGAIEATSANGVSGSVTLSSSPGGDVVAGGSIDVSDTAGGSGGVVSIVAGGNLTANGTINATSNNDGGRVDMTGTNVSLQGASVDVSGSNQGGLIRIGGAFDGGAPDDGSSDYQYFVTRFGTLPSLANATTVTVDANSSLQANGTLTTTGGTISLFSTQNTSIDTSNWRANGLDGAAAVASWGAIGNLTFSTNQSDGGPDTAEHLFYGAQDILIADAPDGSGYSYLNRLDLMANIRNARTVTIATSDSLNVVGDFDPMEGPGVFDIESLHNDNVQSLPTIYQQGTLRSVTLDAGKSITVDGVLDSQAGDLYVTANDPAANNAQPGDRSAGPAIIDLRNASLDTDQIEEQWGPSVDFQSGTQAAGRDITISLLAGADNGAGGLIRLPTIDPWQNNFAGEGGENGAYAPDFNDLTVSAGGQSAIEFNGNVGTNLGFQSDGFGNDFNPPSGTLSLSGDITFAADSTIMSNNLIWNGVSVDQSYAQSQVSAGAISPSSSLAPGATANYIIENGVAPLYDQSDESPTVGNPVYSGSVTAPVPLVALPVNGALQSGQASIDASVTNALTITQSTEQAVIDWDSFSIGTGGTVTFVQPDSAAAVLNRVSASAGVSEIDGTLSANGQVYLVNPNGVAISSTGVVNTTGGFIASSASIALDDFAGGTLSFTGASAPVTNAGTIATGSGGLVALLGSTVANSGSITAPQGQIALAAGGGFSLEPADGSVVDVTAATPDTTASDTIVSQTGSLTAAGGAIALKAEGNDPSLDQVLSNTGGIDVQGASTSGGSIFIQTSSAAANVGGTLAADQSAEGFGSYAAGGTGGVISLDADGSLTLTGDLTVQGDSGGRIDVTGTTVALTGATLDASGQTNGGLLRIGAAYRYGASDDGGADYQAFVGRFGTLPSLTTAGSVAIDSATILKAGGGTSGGVLIVGSTDTTQVDTLWADSIADVSFSSLGVVSALPNFSGAPSGLNTLQLGAQIVEVTGGSPSGSGVTALDLQSITGDLPGLSDLIVEAADTLSIPAGANLSLGQGANVSLAAGRGITFTGVFNAGGANLSAVANEAGAEGAPSSDRNSGAGFIDLSGGTVESVGTAAGNLSFTLSAGLDNAAGGQILLPIIDQSGGVPSQTLFGNLAFEADGAGRIVLNGDITTQSGELTLTGDLQVDAASIVSSDNLDWTTASTAGIYGPGTGNASFSADFALESNGVVLQRGVVGDGQAARVALDGLSSASDATDVYGVDANDLANQAFRLINGSLAAGDTLGTDLSPGTVTVNTGSSSLLGVGDHALTVDIANGLPQPGDKVGYVFDLTAPAAGEIDITPRPITFDTADANSTYGTLATLTGTLANLVPGDTVSAVFGLTQGGAPVDLETRTPAGSYQVVAGLTGASASNYEISATGNTIGVLTVSPLTLTGFTGPNLTDVYGTTPTLSGGQVSGVLSGDQVSPVLGLSQQGSSVALTSRVNAGTYDVVLSGLSGAQAADYSLPTTNVTNGQLVVSPLQISASVTSASYTYGSPAPVVTLTGVLAGDQVSPTVGLTPSGGVASETTLETNGSGFGLAANANVGSYSAVLSGLSGASASDYTLAANSTVSSIQISPKALTFSIGQSETSVYGDDSVSGATLAGVLAGDTVNPVYYVQSGTGAATPLVTNTSVGNYALLIGALSGASAGNYVIASSGNSDGSLSITAKTIDYTVENLVTTYGSPSNPVVETPGLLAGDDVTFSFHVFGDNQLTTSDIYVPVTGSTPYSLAFTISGSAAGDYNFQPDGGDQNPTWTVLPRPITYAGGNATSTYGSPAALSSAISGVLPGDQVSGALQVTTTLGAGVSYGTYTDVGTYDLGISSLSGAQAANYVIDPSVYGILTITPKAISFGGQINATYGTTASLNLTGVLTGDDVNAAFDVSTPGGGTISYDATTTVGTYDLSDLTLTGSKASDYTLEGGGTGTLIISPKSVTYGGGDVSTTYGTAASLPDVINGLVAGDSVTAPVVVSAAGGIEITYGARTSAGSYTLGLGPLSGPEAEDYVIDPSITGLLSIAPMSITLTSGAISATYGDGDLPVQGAASDLAGGDFSGILAGDQVEGDFAIASPSMTASGRLAAGTYGLSLLPGGLALTGAQAGDYVLDPSSPTTGSLVVAPKPVTLTSAGFSTTYGDSTLQANGELSDQIGGQFSGVLSGDSLSGVFGVAATLNANGRLDAGSYTLNLLSGGAGFTGAEAADYVLSVGSPTTGSLVVSPEPITLTSAVFSDIYGDTSLGAVGSIAQQDGGQFSGILAGDSVTGVFNVTGSLNSAGRLDVGTYQLDLDSGTAGLTGAQASDYVLAAGSPTAGTLTISARTLTYAGGDVSTTYGTAATLSDTLDGLLGGDQVNAPLSVTDSGGDAVVYGARTSAGDYTLSLGALSGAQALDYVVDPSATGTLAIAPKPITLTSADLTAIYGDVAYPNPTTPIPAQDGGQFSGILSGDSVTGVFTVSGSPNNNLRLDVGTYQLTLEPGSAALTGAQADDYVLAAGSPTTGALSITPRSVTYGGGDISATYGTQANLSDTISGILSGDDVFAPVTVTDVNGSVITYGARTSPGDYTFSLGALTGAQALDYVVAASAAGTLAIAPKPITLTSAVFSDIYGDTSLGAVGSIAQQDGGQFSGILAGDSVTGVFNVTGSLNSAGRLDVGTYQLDLGSGTAGLTGAQASDYVLAAGSPTTGTLTISPRTLTYAGGDVSTTYGTQASLADSVEGLLSGDAVSAQLTVTDSNGDAVVYGARTSAGDYTLSLGSLTGAQALDYVVGPSTAGALTIAPKPITLTAADLTADYGDASLGGSGTIAPQDGGVFSGILAGDNVTGVFNVSGSVNGAGFLNAGAYQLTLQSGVASLTGAQAGDYVLAAGSPTTGTLTVSPRPVTYTIAPLSSVYGDVPGFSYTLTNGFTGMGTPIIDVSASQGGAPTLAPTGLDVGTYYPQIAGISGDSLSNYSLTFANPATALLTITPRPVSFTGAYSTTYGSNLVPASQFQAMSGSAGLLPGDTLTATTAITGSDISQMDVGTYTYDQLTFGGSKLEDYAISVVGPQTVTITPKALEVTFSNVGLDETYGALTSGCNCAAPAPVMAEVSGFVDTADLSLTTDAVDHQASGNVDVGAGNFFQASASGTSITLNLNPQADACNCTYSVTGLSGPQAKDYVIDPNSSSFTINPAPLTVVSPGSVNTTYGQTDLVGPSLSGFVSPSDATSTELVLSSASSNFLTWAGSSALTLAPETPYEQSQAAINPGTATYNDALDATGSATPLDVGTYSYTISGLTGPAARNYYIASGSTTGAVSITPATLSYSVLQDEYYGEQKGVELTTSSATVYEVDLVNGAAEFTPYTTSDSVCCAMEPDTRPIYQITSSTFGANVGLDLTFIDSSGSSHTYTPTLEAGTYGVDAAITGPQAEDFVLQSTPVTFTVHPAIITYQITGGSYYVPNIGYIDDGSAPTATLSGAYGSDQVGLVIGVFQGSNTSDRNGADLVDVNTAQPGIYHYQAVGLLAPDPNDYVLGPPSVYFDSGPAMQIVSTGLTFDPAASLSVSVASGITLVSGEAAASTGTATSSSSIPTEILTIAEGQSISAGVSTDASTSTSLGDATLTAGVETGADASASYNAANVKASASANAQATLTVSYGPGYTTAGVDATANAQVELKLISTSPNLSGSAGVELKAYVTEGVSGSLGPVGTGSASVTGDVLVKATASGTIGDKNGVLTESATLYAGAGVSGSATGSVTGSVGSAQAGVTGYFDTAGVTANTGLGYSNGDVTYSLTFGVAAELGFQVSFSVGINVGAAASGLDTAAHAVLNPNLFGPPPAPPSFSQSIQAITANPFTDPTDYRNALYAIVNAQQQNSGSYSGATLANETLAANLLNAQSDYTTLVTSTIPAEQQTSMTLMTMLATNPQAFTAADLTQLENVQSAEASALSELQSDVGVMTGGKDTAQVTPSGISIVPTAATAAADALTTASATVGALTGTLGQ